MSALAATSAARVQRALPPTAHLEIAATRHQRQARPRATYAIATVVGVFVILLTQLMLSIVLSDGAYRVTALEAQRGELDRAAQVLSERINVYDSAQNVATNAESLGMVVNTVSPVFLLLSDGSVQGSPTPAGTGTGLLDRRGDLVGNVLLANVPLVIAAVAADSSTLTSGVPAAPLPLGSLPSGSGVAPATGSLPSPVTR